MVKCKNPRRKTVSGREAELRDLGILFEQAPDAIMVADAKTGIVVGVNPAAERMLGRSRRALCGRHYLAIHPRQQAGQMRRVFDHLARRGGGPQEVELVRSNGTRLTVDVSASRIVYGGRPLVAGFFRDVTARRQMENALRDSEERFRTLATNAPVVLFVLDRKGVFTLSEGKGLAKLGLKPGQVVGRSCFEVYRDYPQITRVIRMALAGRTVLRELAVNDLTYEVNLSPVRDERGRVARVIGLANDITERKRVEAALADEHNLHMDLVKSVPAGVYRLHIRSQKPWGRREWVGKVESNYRLEIMSDRFCQLLGASRRQLETNAATVVDCLHPDDRQDFVRNNVVALETMQPFDWEGRVRHPGPTQWIRFLSVPRRMPNGDVIWTGVLYDITEAKLAVEALQKSREELEDKVRERTARLRALAAQLTEVEHKERRRIAELLHEDIQQRMVAIMYIIRGLMEDKKGHLDDKMARLLLKQLTEAIEMMRNLITRFRPPALYELGLRPALEWMAGQMHDRFGVDVAIKGNKNVRIRENSMLSFAYQAVSELLMNVVKHAGARRAQVLIRRKGRTGVLIEVSDRGCGFIVGKAQRAASFGLFNISERAADFGGRFSIKSQPGKRTCATIELPTARAPAMSERRARQAVRRIHL